MSKTVVRVTEHEVDGEEVVVFDCPSEMNDEMRRFRSAALLPGMGWVVPAAIRSVVVNRLHQLGVIVIDQGELPPAGHRPTKPGPPRPPWCGACDEKTRLIVVVRPDTGAEALARCQRCHPLRGQHFETVTGQGALAVQEAQRARAARADVEPTWASDW